MRSTRPKDAAQLATIGQAFALPEEQAYPLIEKLGATHVVVVFGGYAGYSSDDLNKFTWMLRIAGGAGSQEVNRSSSELRSDLYLWPVKWVSALVSTSLADAQRAAPFVCVWYRTCTA